MDLRKTLEELGYSAYHSNVLLFLISNDKFATAKEVSVGAEVPLSRVYSILIELEKQGLVRSIPGKKTTYTVVEKKKFLQQVGNKKTLDLKMRKEKMEAALQLLNKRIEIASKSPQVTVRHFLNDKEYWEVYNSEVTKLGKGDIYRVINSARWAHSLLPSEVESKPGIKSMIIQDLKRQREGLKIHHMADPDAIVSATKQDLKTKQKITESLAQMLFYDNTPEIKKNNYITLAPELKNVMIFILKDSIFFEFYLPGIHTKLLSAVQIKSSEITKDFSRWFDSYSSKKHNPDEDYKKFKKALLNSAEKIAGIKPKDVEALIKVMRPVYG